MTIGFACRWDAEPDRTWSGTPWNLLQAMQAQHDVVDLGPHLSPVMRQALRVAHLRRSNGGWRSQWAYGRPVQNLTQKLLDKNVTGLALDAVLQVHDLGRFPQPTWMLQDLTYDALAQVDPSLVSLQFDLGSRQFETLRKRQHALLDEAAGVFVMSQWLKDQIVASGAVEAERITVARPGATAAFPPDQPRPSRTFAGRKLLFVGRQFGRKGGPQTLQALAQLRQKDPSITLTICGPPTWPMDTPIPEGVNFVGPQPSSAVADLFASHDVFVLPSRFEAFGIVFLEALSHGVPCVARNDFAMPEVIEAGVNGDLVTSEDPEELAHQILGVLDNSALRRSVHERSADFAATCGWDTTASVILRSMGVATSDAGDDTSVPARR